MDPKRPKGTRDFLPDECARRLTIERRLASVFERFGGRPVDTPAMELRSVLMDKYGEDSRLVYDLADQGGEILSLRYDLTVPFARLVAQHGLGNTTRYQIGKVWRRDQPQASQGRFREFTQADFDITGEHAPMVADATVIAVLRAALDANGLKHARIRVSHRQVLETIMAAAGVSRDKFRPACAAIDKLDKLPKCSVRAELLAKGVSAEAADAVLGALLTSRVQDLPACSGRDDLDLLFTYLEAMGVRATLDLCVARGLDYYTGVIFEAGVDSHASVAGGGRYDDLVGSLANRRVPAVGVSVGVDRVMLLGSKGVEPAPKAFVATAGANVGMLDRVRLASELRGAGIATRHSMKAGNSMADQIKQALDCRATYLVTLGQTEVDSGAVRVKTLETGAEAVVPRDSLGHYIF